MRLQVLFFSALISATIAAENKGDQVTTSATLNTVVTRKLAPSRGQFRILVLLVKFADQSERVVPPTSHYHDLCNGALRDFLTDQSYGAYDITCHVDDWRVLPGTEASYAGQNGDGASMFEPILTELATNGGLDFIDFDLNGDGFLDNVLVIHSGFSAAGAGGKQCGENEQRNRLRSQAHVGSDNPMVQAWEDPVWGIQLQGYTITSAFERICNFEKYAGIGAIANMMLKSMGAMGTADLSSGGIGGLGSWDVLAHPGGYTKDSNEPGSLSPFSKNLLGWLEYEAIDEEGRYTIWPSNERPNVYKIQRGFPAGEYILVEYRQPTKHDANMYGGQGGLLIYHCDAAVIGWGTHGYPGQADWPANGNHYRCALLQADGKYQLEKGSNSGDAGDLWTPGMKLGPGVGGVFPNTDAYQSGIVTQTGLQIYDIVELGSVMVFSVSWSPEQTGSLSSPVQIAAQESSGPDSAEFSPKDPVETTEITLTNPAPSVPLVAKPPISDPLETPELVLPQPPPRNPMVGTQEESIKKPEMEQQETVKRPDNIPEGVTTRLPANLLSVPTTSPDLGTLVPPIGPSDADSSGEAYVSSGCLDESIWLAIFSSFMLLFFPF